MSSGGADSVVVWRKAPATAATNDIWEMREGPDSDVIMNGVSVGQYGKRFSRNRSDPHYDAGLPFDDPTRLAVWRREDAFGEPPILALRGWRIEKPVGIPTTSGVLSVQPGDRLVVTLAWEVLAQTFSPHAQIFLHLEREGDRTIAQSDGPPRPPVETVCGKPRALTSLTAGETLQDRRVIDIAADEPPGQYELLVGLYDYETGERQRVSWGPDAGSTRGQLATINVTPADEGP
ncbi:MAG: hypothetical protein U0470_11025 [Anaerolineae bacterium]